MNAKAGIAEFIGTFSLVLIGVGAVATDMLVRGGAPSGASGLLAIALAHGFVIACMASATASVSGGHLNPAVTLAALLTGKIRFADALVYWAAQFGGATLGAGVLALCIPGNTLASINGGVPALGPDPVTPINAVIMEVFLTFFLVFVIFGTAVDRRAPRMGALFIGLAVTFGILAGAGISGGCMNPARYLGPAIFNSGEGQFANAWVYFVGPALGAVLGGLVYHHIFEEKATPEPRA